VRSSEEVPGTVPVVNLGGWVPGPGRRQGGGLVGLAAQRSSSQRPGADVRADNAAAAGPTTCDASLDVGPTCSGPPVWRAVPRDVGRVDCPGPAWRRGLAVTSGHVARAQNPLALRRAPVPPGRAARIGTQSAVRIASAPPRACRWCQRLRPRPWRRRGKGAAPPVVNRPTDADAGAVTWRRRRSRRGPRRKAVPAGAGSPAPSPGRQPPSGSGSAVAYGPVRYPAGVPVTAASGAGRVQAGQVQQAQVPAARNAVRRGERYRRSSRVSLAPRRAAEATERAQPRGLGGDAAR